MIWYLKSIDCWWNTKFSCIHFSSICKSKKTFIEKNEWMLVIENNIFFRNMNHKISWEKAEKIPSIHKSLLFQHYHHHKSNWWEIINILEYFIGKNCSLIQIYSIQYVFWGIKFSHLHSIINFLLFIQFSFFSFSTNRSCFSMKFFRLYSVLISNNDEIYFILKTTFFRKKMF